MSTTLQAVEIGSKEGKAFLRRVVRQNLARRDEWTLYATQDEGWRVILYRTVAGKTGEPDQSVRVETDAGVSLTGETGLRKPFSDAAEVIVPEPRRLALHGGDVRTAAKLLLDGWHFVVTASAGSTTSSKLGLAFHRLTLERRGDTGWDIVGIGHESVYVNGDRVIAGSVDT